MADDKFFECGVCGALLKKETGETYYPKGSNAESMEELKKKNTTLQADLARITDAHNKLIGKEAEVTDDDDGGSGETDNPGKKKSGDNDDEFWDDKCETCPGN